MALSSAAEKAKRLARNERRLGVVDLF